MAFTFFFLLFYQLYFLDTLISTNKRFYAYISALPLLLLEHTSLQDYNER